MATVMFANQLGAGSGGHLLQMLPLAEGLIARGVRVYMAFRDLPAAAATYGRVGIRFLQAPAKFYPRPLPDGIGFAHLLHVAGFGDDAELFALAAAWRNLFMLVRPSLIVIDHSPIALLAARGLTARRVSVGTGFFSPPDAYPLPALRPPGEPLAPDDAARLAADEDRILRRVNWVLDHWRQPPLDRLGRLYSEVDECFLTTFPELDHFGARGGVRYWGPVNGTGGESPAWPEGPSASRIFAYLKPFPALEPLLEVLRDGGFPTVVQPDGIPPAARQRFASATLRFATRRLDPSAAAAGCDAAVLNAGHGTTCDVLLAGKPVLQFPLHEEQRLFASAVERLGAGRTLRTKGEERDAIKGALDELTNRSSAAADIARQFAARYSNVDLRRRRAEMIERLHQLTLAAGGSAAQREESGGHPGVVKKARNPAQRRRREGGARGRG